MILHIGYINVKPILRIIILGINIKITQKEQIENHSLEYRFR